MLARGSIVYSLSHHGHKHDAVNANAKMVAIFNKTVATTASTLIAQSPL